MSETKIIAVVVTYQPDMEIFHVLLRSLAPQVNAICVVDNSADESIGLSLPEVGCFADIYIKRLGENLGLAAAQNFGMEWAMENGGTHILLLDQDSIPQEGMVDDLLGALNLDEGLTVAAAGPCYIDRRTGHSSFFVLDRSGKPGRFYPGVDCEKVIDVGFLIASGTLISVAALKLIRGMRSDYFIDHVDTEWCFRARACGFRLLGVPRAKLSHTLGDEVSRFRLLGRDIQVASHAPLRDYYMSRNTILMLRDVAMGWRWRFHFFLRLLLLIIYFLLFVDQRRLRFRLVMAGLRHGWLGLDGRLNPLSLRCDSIARSALDPKGPS